MKNLFKYMVLIVFTGALILVLTELVLLATYAMGLLAINKPTYSTANVDAYFWSDLHPKFGTWHHPGSTYRHRSACFDVEYSANSYGARDRERELVAAPPRIIVLGDSFIEGYGLERHQRLSDRLESATGIAHLNFGVGGDVGPTQYYLIYETLARRYSHQGVLVGLFPANDFQDSSYQHGLRHHSDRYRAYFKGEPPDLELVHYNQEAFRWTLYADFPHRLKRWLREFTYTYNFLIYIKAIFATNQTHSFPSGYFRHDQKQLAIVLHALGELAKAVGDHPLVAFTIPTLAEIEAFDAGKRSQLPDTLQRFARANGFTYVDLLPLLHQSGPPWSSYYLSCDPHWSAAGNELAADRLAETLLYRQR